MKKVIIFITTIFIMVLLSACASHNVGQVSEIGDEVISNDLPSNDSTEDSARSSAFEDDTTNQAPSEIQTPVISTDFTDTLGFKLAAWSGTPVVEQYIVDDSIAEMKFIWDKSNIAYLRVAVSPSSNIKGFKDEIFEQNLTENIEFVSVKIEYTMSGPMQANWTKDGYNFCLYMKAGETEMAGNSFQDWVGHYITEFLIEPTPAKPKR